MAGSEPRSLNTLSSSSELWTNAPVHIDTAIQNYERLPAVYSSYVTDPPRVPSAVAAIDLPSEAPNATTPSYSAEHVAWCGSRYRSYDPTSNSYRAYSGDNKICVSPYTVATPAQSAVATVTTSYAAGGGAAWCAERFQSYRASDNTYQPYDGPRRTCVPPAKPEIAWVRQADFSEADR
ncbi:BA14K family protein [Rhizobium sp. Root708]|uniref:BA14K family protein n=1 Tax=Rhizobium sp. Root708 TaxID=1736592 RepID=UPI001FCDD70A|nr:BA14K family protein [Rhizobium sp. Root708]